MERAHTNLNKWTVWQYGRKCVPSKTYIYISRIDRIEPNNLPAIVCCVCVCVDDLMHIGQMMGSFASSLYQHLALHISSFCHVAQCTSHGQCINFFSFARWLSRGVFPFVCVCVLFLSFCLSIPCTACARMSFKCDMQRFWWVQKYQPPNITANKIIQNSIK